MVLSLAKLTNSRLAYQLNFSIIACRSNSFPFTNHDSNQITITRQSVASVSFIMTKSVKFAKSTYLRSICPEKSDLSYVYRSAKFDVKFFNFFCSLFYFVLLSVRKVSYIGER